MADTKISALTSLAGSDLDIAADELAIVDGSAGATKRITAAALLEGLVNSPIKATGSASVTVDLASRGLAVVQFNMSGFAGTMTLTLNNPVDGGIYIFHYKDADSGPSVTYPATVYGADGAARGTDSAIVSGWEILYYHATDAVFYTQSRGTGT